jgi:hypothetical protein
MFNSANYHTPKINKGEKIVLESIGKQQQQQQNHKNQQMSLNNNSKCKWS